MSSDSELIALDPRFAKVLDLPLEAPREVLIERMAELAQLITPSHPVTTKRPETRELLVRFAHAGQRLPELGDRLGVMDLGAQPGTYVTTGDFWDPIIDDHVGLAIVAAELGALTLPTRRGYEGYTLIEQIFASLEDRISGMADQIAILMSEAGYFEILV